MPLAGGKLLTYAAGTTTPLATFSDVNLSVANGIPPTGLTLDSSGRPQSGAIFLPPGASYKFVLQDALGNVVATRDNVSTVPGAAGNVDITGVAGQTVTGGQAVYLSDGSAGRTAGLWYVADSSATYSSTTPEIGIVPATIASGASGTIRLVGSISGLTSLSVGALYYIGSVGSIAVTGARLIGQADSTTSLIMGGGVASTGYDFGQLGALI